MADTSELSTELLTKTYGTLVAVDRLSIVAHKGELLALLGPNGAGKTTLMRMLAGLLQPDSGTISILGRTGAKIPVKEGVPFFEVKRAANDRALRRALLKGEVGIGMVVASLAKSQTRAFLFASVAMFLLLLFSGIVFPRPAVTVWTIGERHIDLFDILPTTHMGSALEKIMTLGAGVSEVAYELLALLAIGLLSFGLGEYLFARSGRPSAQIWEGLP